MPNAQSHRTGSVLRWNDSDLAPLLEASRQSPRLRMIQPMHRSDGAHVQRMLNAMQPGTFIRPHRHPIEHACEGVVLIRGRVLVLIYNDGGEVIERYELQQPGDIIDIEPFVWHSMICQGQDSVIAEYKLGPYDPKTDKEFASWAPSEGDQERIMEFFKRVI